MLLYNFNEFTQPTRPQRWPRLSHKPPQQTHLNASLLDQIHHLPKERVIFLVREPPFEEKRQHRRAHYQHAAIYCSYCTGPDDLAPQPDIMPAIWYHTQPFQALQSMPAPPKTRLCSWITSGVNRTANHRRRLDFLRSLQAHNLAVDLYGRDLPDWAMSHGPVSQKWHAMAPYYYNLAIENYADNEWYVSEKLWDALLAWCLPIYYGGPAADRLLPPGSFLRLPAMDERGLAYIQDVTATPDAWYAAQTAIAEARQIILHQLNLLNWLSDVVTQLE